MSKNTIIYFTTTCNQHLINIQNSMLKKNTHSFKKRACAHISEFVQARFNYGLTLTYFCNFLGAGSPP